ncbi:MULTISPECIES: rhodanese-like domain-containing protein [Paenibacillus]|uniref:rhodanese-like domain-containing protein n=1 Tax=Paenibacillus TaxID=44249 RepID=UPI0022B86000|nr:rhodanese-like domain-containing protein [Paenibacillus caseinilyticus]MCZ8521848.1 rhodanese-like domain-containing protein [Paenibacillus caseinilyticus]
MNWFLYSLVLALMVFSYKRMKPVKGLRPIHNETLLFEKMKNQKVKVLDVRDPVDYYKQHIPGAINIYVGRLPHVRKNELSSADEIVIVSSSEYKIKKAARNLLKSGFTNLSSYVWVDTTGH